MVLRAGEKVHIVERRYFTEDIRRHFVGKIVESSENAFRIEGYVWVFDPMHGFVRKAGVRERVIYPSDRVMINIIPQEVRLDEIKYVLIPQKGLAITDGKKFTLDINEFGATR